MANTLAPIGLSHVSNSSGSAPTFEQASRLISKSNTTPVFRGDPVTASSGYMVQSTPGTTQIHGVFMGCRYQSVSMQTTVWKNYWPGTNDAAADIEAFVVENPSANFEIQANGQLLPSHVGKNANFAIGTGNTATGFSGASLDVATIATTATLPLRIIGLKSAPPGANGTDQTSPYGIAIVTFNNQDFKSLTGL